MGWEHLNHWCCRQAAFHFKKYGFVIWMVCLCIAFVLFLVALGILSCWCASHNFWCWPGRGFSHVVQCWFLFLLHSCCLFFVGGSQRAGCCLIDLKKYGFCFVAEGHLLDAMPYILRDDACSS